ncbi:unannotated protein [freshwater metagenome]|uniref:Unannotated protein n=1 Tax=freshwater metagenome TaxID=449393 RepID=A0A6J6ZM67_9ZZZZ
MQLAQSGITLSNALLQVIAPNILVLVRIKKDRHPTIGDFGSCRDAQTHQTGPPDRDVFTNFCAWLNDLEGLTQSCSETRGQRSLHSLTFNMKRFFASPDVATCLDVFLNAQHRLFVWHAMEAFDHLRATCTKPKNESTVRDVVTTSSGHRHQRWRTTENVQNSGTNFDLVGLGGEVTNLANGVGTVGLGNPHGIKASLFVFDNFVNRGMKSTGVIEHHGQFHIFPLLYEIDFRTFAPRRDLNPTSATRRPTNFQSLRY